MLASKGEIFSPPLDHVKNIYGSIFAFITPITTKFGKMAD